MNIEGRERLTDEARALIHEEFKLARDSIGRREVEHAHPLVAIRASGFYRRVGGVFTRPSRPFAAHELHDSVEQPARWRAQSGRLALKDSRPGCSV
jgi:hypothetical protein